MSDSFRDLESFGNTGRKDAVLLATVSSFEDMTRPTRHDIQQFTDLFIPLFSAASDDARRTAAAALSQCDSVPEAVVRTIVDQPIEIAAPLLVNSRNIADAWLIDILARHGSGHAKAIARRESLSSRVIDALASLDDSSVRRTLGLRRLLSPGSRPPSGTPAVATREHKAERPAEHTARRTSEDILRQQLKALVMRRQPGKPMSQSFLPGSIAPDLEARLSDHAQKREAMYFTTALADALASSFQLAERIMLDVSGRQLGETLVALGLRYTTIVIALEGFFPHLAGIGEDGARRSLTLLRTCSFVECVERIAAWKRADVQTRPAADPVPQPVDLPSAPHRRANGARPDDRQSSPQPTKVIPLRRA